MNRIVGLILAFSVVAVTGCASAGGSAGPSKAAAGDSHRPSENRMTREANRNLGLALLRETLEEQRPLLEEALASAQEAIEANPQNPLGWRLAGQAHAKLGQYVEADSAFSRAVALYPPYEEEVDAEREEAWVDAYNAAIGAYQAGDIEGAIEGMEYASLIYQKRPEALHVLGSFYANDDELDKAADAFSKALDIIRDPSLTPEDEELAAEWVAQEEELVTNLGQLLNILGRPADAEAIYRDYLNRNPDHLSTEVSLAVSLTEQGKDEEAHEVFTRLASRDDLDENQLVMIGIGMFNADDFVSAADAFRSVTEMNPYSRDAYVNLSMALLRQSLEIEEAQEEGADPEAEATLATLYKEMIATSEQARRLDPYNREALTFSLRAYQGLTQLESEAANLNQHQSELQNIIREYENLPLSVEDLSIQAGAADVMISGVLINLQEEEGETVQLRFNIHSADGNVLGSEVVEVVTGAPESDRVPFQVTIPVSAEMEGWSYERVQ